MDNYKFEQVMDITGVSLDEALYYVHRGYALRVVNDDNEITIYAYDKRMAQYMYVM